ncbi:MAG: SDR family oxidoreductase [Desulfobacterales bacterium]|jgi:NAD(P)-dependent dehydrogenase (short-subunit alcohol dehydrogenase family)
MGENDRVVLITGASSGIGRCCAEHLSQNGCRVYGTSRRASDADTTGGFPVSDTFTMMMMDVNDGASVRKGVAHVIAQESRLDVVVNNAGFAIAGALEDTTIQEAKSQLETNFFGALRVCRSALPIMRQQGSGYIVNMSSLGGLFGLPFQSAYSASKYALEGATEALRQELKPFGIKVVLIEPGDFRTDITRRRMITKKALRDSVYFDTFQRVLDIIETNERDAPTPEKIARLVCKIINLDAPRLHYTVGKFSQRIAAPAKKFLPSRWFESVLARNFRLK